MLMLGGSCMFLPLNFAPPRLQVIIGVAFATLGEYDFTMLGFVLTLLGTFLAALKYGV